jgi:hypothetical protein
MRWSFDGAGLEFQITKDTPSRAGWAQVTAILRQSIASALFFLSLNMLNGSPLWNMPTVRDRYYDQVARSRESNPLKRSSSCCRMSYPYHARSKAKFDAEPRPSTTKTCLSASPDSLSLCPSRSHLLGPKEISFIFYFTRKMHKIR